MLPVEPLERENKCRSLVQESCTRCKMSVQRWIRFQNFRTCLCKHACTNSGCEVQEFCMQETRLWAPRAHEEEARSRFLRTHRHLHCGTKGVEKGSGRRLYSPGASLYKGLVQCTRSGRVRIDDCRIHARLCASHLQGNADLPGTWFKPHCADHLRSFAVTTCLGCRLHVRHRVHLVIPHARSRASLQHPVSAFVLESRSQDRRGCASARETLGWPTWRRVHEPGMRGQPRRSSSLPLN